MSDKRFLTTHVGSLPRPDWLAEPEKLKGGWKLSGQALFTFAAYNLTRLLNLMQKAA